TVAPPPVRGYAREGSPYESIQDVFGKTVQKAASDSAGMRSMDGNNIQTQEAAQRALGALDKAIIKKDNIRAHIGAMQNRLENTITNLSTQAENMQASESRISDVDVATEMTEFVRNQILTQSAVAMLSQANSLPQMAMKLIGG
ncbi:MAG: flagellin, partial [Bilophila sp.]